MSGLEPGSTLGGYRIVARLRAGAMGVLFLARRASKAGFVRPVAIKVIHDHLAQNKRFCRMFIGEAKLSARIDDPHVVRVEEFGQADGRYYLVMEYVHGPSLAQALGVLKKRGGIPSDVAVAIAMQIAAGLHGAHEATDEEGAPLGIVHRDVSPHNVLVSYRGHVKLIDFGIAKAKESGGQTLTGSIRGKLAYMPPEQARSAKHVDRRADIYALGLVLWEMLAGRRLFDAPSDIALLNQIKNPVIVPPSAIATSAPRELDAIVLEMLAEDPDRRPPTAAVVQRMLAEAYPAATKVVAADIAKVMAGVRDAATSTGASAAASASSASPATASSSADAAGAEADDAAEAYGEQVRTGLTVFGKSMNESVALADSVLLAGPALSDDGSGHETEVMAKPPVSLASESLVAQPDGRPPLVAHDEPTRRMNALARPIARGQAQVRTLIAAENPYLAGGAPPPARGPFALPSNLPAWVTPPVLVLAPLCLILVFALVVVQCTRTTAGRKAESPDESGSRTGSAGTIAH